MFLNDSGLLVGDTIAAVATPPGRGAIALIRVSGKEACTLVRRHIVRWPNENRHATLSDVVDHNGALLDRALVTVFLGPQSFTGEDMVEIGVHGGEVVSALVMAALIRSGVRGALPGEFTRRAVLNGKLDLVQAEAVGDLIDAQSQAMHTVAIQQLNGKLSQRVLELRERIIELEAFLAYDIDFPEEDDGPISHGVVLNKASKLVYTLDQLLATASTGEVVRKGALVVIAGAPNVGKSSLFNAILGMERAIVTNIPGTTRDAIETVIDVGPWPVRLVDTAGLRATHDIVEQLGIEVSTRYLGSANVVLACGDTDEKVEEAVANIKAMTSASVIGVRTKADSGPSEASIRVSVVTGDGISIVLESIVGALSVQHGPLLIDAPILLRERHRYALDVARGEIEAFRLLWSQERLPAPVAATHLRIAAHALEEMIGTVDVEDILDRLFGTFCVGK